MIPSCRPRLLMAPYLTPYIIRHAIAAITGETIDGMTRSAVMIGRPRSTRLRRSAIPSPSKSSDQRRGDEQRGVPDRAHEALVSEERLRVVLRAHEFVLGPDREVEVLERQIERVGE